MRIHIFQHESYESPAVIEDWIKERKHSLTFTRFFEDCKLPDLTGIDWLIIMGGPMSANDDDKFPWLKGEKDFIRSAIDGGKIVLGICLGSQLIAAALDAKVYPNKFKEIGWLSVSLTEDSKGNSLFSSLPGRMSVCQWHGDTFDLPEGAVLMAESEACKNQAFVYNERVIGLQFHLEFDEETITDLIKHGERELIKDEYVQTGQEIMQNKSLLTPANNLLIRLLDEINSLPDGKDNTHPE